MNESKHWSTVDFYEESVIEHIWEWRIKIAIKTKGKVYLLAHFGKISLFFMGAALKTGKDKFVV